MDEQSKVNGREISPVAGFAVHPARGKPRTCHNYWCNYTTDRPLSRCPQCGRPLLTVQTYKLLGLALVLLGGCLGLVGALLLIFAAPGIVSGTGAKLFVWSIFGLLLAIGLTVMTAGFWQVFFGKRNQSLMTIAIALIITIMLIAAIGRTVL
jgi:hypothetical protein